VVTAATRLIKSNKFVDDIALNSVCEEDMKLCLLEFRILNPLFAQRNEPGSARQERRGPADSQRVPRSFDAGHLFITPQVIAGKSARYILPVSRYYRGHISD